MRAFVTGATGFVGTNLVRELVALGWDVTAIHRASSRTSQLPDSVHLLPGDVTDRASLAAAMPVDVDAVFHTAGNTSLWSLARDEQTRTNVVGTRNVVMVAIEKRARRFVHTSSIAAFGHHDERISESTASNAARSPINYHRTKWLAEEEVRRGIEEGLDAVMINPPHIVGPWDWGNWSRVIRLAREGKLPGVPPGRASWCHVREVVRAHVAAVSKGRCGENYLLGGTDATYLEAVTVVGTLTGKKVPSRPLPASLLKLVAAGNQLVSHRTRREPDITPEGARLVCESTLADCSRAVAELGFQPVPLEEMFGDCWRWMLDEGTRQRS